LCSSSILLIISCASIQAAFLFVCLCGISELKAAYIYGSCHFENFFGAIAKLMLSSQHLGFVLHFETFF
jgi:hypothetical protein